MAVVVFLPLTFVELIDMSELVELVRIDSASTLTRISYKARLLVDPVDQLSKSGETVDGACLM